MGINMIEVYIFMHENRIMKLIKIVKMGGGK
jgi:hypothetical protein